MADRIIHLDDHRPQITVICDNGERHTYTERHLERVAAGTAPLSSVAPTVLQSIVGQWLHFVDYIDQFDEDT